jgi:hypothetical protein
VEKNSIGGKKMNKIKLILLFISSFFAFNISSLALTDAELTSYHQKLDDYDKRLDKIETDAITKSYPTNSIYISARSLAPESLFSNTKWESFGAGRTLIGVGGSFTSANATGGTYNYSSSTSSHFDYSENEDSVSTLEIPVEGIDGNYEAGDSFTSQMATTNNAGPYIAVYYWKRTE